MSVRNPILQVKKACGNPTHQPTMSTADDDGNSSSGSGEAGDAADMAAARSSPSSPSGHHHQYKPMTPPPNAEMLRFLVEIYNSKDFYSKIVDRYVCHSFVGSLDDIVAAAVGLEPSERIYYTIDYRTTAWRECQ